MKIRLLLASLMALAVSASAVAAPTSYSSIERDDYEAESRYLLGDWQLSPKLGFTAIRSTIGFNVGTDAAYQLLSSAPLFFEPGFAMGFFEDLAQFNFGAGARYDIAIDGTRIRPFAKFSLGPTFQTKGDVVVFNAYAGFGVMLPLSDRQAARFDAGLTNVDGNAGFQAMAGVAF